LLHVLTTICSLPPSPRDWHPSLLTIMGQQPPSLASLPAEVHSPVGYHFLSALPFISSRPFLLHRLLPDHQGPRKLMGKLPRI
jgi:hypothetical protein